MAAPDSAMVNYSIDDPNNINAFLARIGGSQLKPATKPAPPASPAATTDHPNQAPLAASDHGSDSNDDSGGVTAAMSACHVSPAPAPAIPGATQACSAPAPPSALRDRHTLGDRLSEVVKLAHESQEGVKQSKHAIPSLRGPPGHKKKKFRARKKHQRNRGVKLSPLAPTSSTGWPQQGLPAKMSKAIGSPTEESATPSVGNSAMSVVPESEAVKKLADHDDRLASFYRQPRATDASQGLDIEPADKATSTMDVKESPNSRLSKAKSKQGLRSVTTSKYVTEKVDGGRALRKVILSGLPSNADLSLVASLLHGGILESFGFMTSDPDTAKHAVALFTEAEAASKYCAMYANGIQYKHGGKKSVALVQLAKECDAFSAVLRGHVEAGATRVIRVNGADEDWSMRALCKLAGEANRKIESICDHWKNEMRKIDFLFTNIADAVNFRAHLLHNSDWQACSILFGEDPCEKATGVHFEL